MRIVKDSNEDYHKSTSISASGLKYIYQNSVYHFLKRKPFTSKAMELGTAVHTILIEGREKYFQDYFEMPEIGDLRKKENRELRDSLAKKAGGKKIITHDEKEIISGLLENFNKNELAKYYCKGEVELSHYTKFNDVDVRVRPDVKTDLWVSDVKTCQKSSKWAFRNDVYKYSYHLQATFYCDVLGVDPKSFRFIACETNYPYYVEVYALSDSDIEKGRIAYKSALNDWKLYLETGIETGYKSDNYAEDGALVL